MIVVQKYSVCFSQSNKDAKGRTAKGRTAKGKKQYTGTLTLVTK
jgi:hypothetical protein